ASAPSCRRDELTRRLPQPRAGADEVESGAAAARELARRGRELPRVDARDRRRELGLERRKLEPEERRRDDGVRPLEEVVDDLDLVGARAEACERVDEPLQPVARLDDLLRRLLGERVRLVVEYERVRAAAPEDVEPAVQEDAVVLEREGPLGHRAREPRDAAGEVGRAVRGDER